MSSTILALKQQLSHLDELGRSGVLPQEQVQAARDKLERQILDAVAAAGPDELAQIAPPAATRPPDIEPASEPSTRMKWGLFAFVVLVGVAGYAWLGNPGAWHTGPDGATAWDGEPQAGATHAVDAEQITAMTERLAQRLSSEPDDAQGWAMLARSYTVLERYADAVAAYQRLIQLQPADAQAHADYADALGMSRGRELDGEPAQLVTKALQLDPQNFKALSLAGTIAFDRRDYPKAVKLWERALQNLPPDSAELSQQMQAAVADARQRAGLPKAAAAPQPPQAAASALAQVSGQVSLSPQAAQQTRAEDTVFILARAAQGPRMPLAILRKQVKDLPLSFTLDDSVAMSEQMKLSNYKQVIVGARVSRSGQAMPQAGDWEGWSQPVAVGAKDVRIQIKDPVR